MPTSTFLNLPKEKQQKIILAAKHEFGRSSVEEASVKNIVTKAEIPRGSFYAYFKDKEDLYHYILEDYRIKTRQLFHSCLEKANKDLFETFILFHNELLIQCEHAKADDFLTNAYLNMRSGINAFLPVRSHEEENKHMVTLLREIKKSASYESLNFQTDQEFQYILELLTTVARNNLSKSLGMNLSFEQASKTFCDKIEILKRGMVK